jgi:GTP cyclohydrolase II
MNIEISQLANLPTKHGDFKIQSFKQADKEHLAIYSPLCDFDDAPCVRIHSECLTGDAIGSIKCDCQAQLNYALEYINKNNGIVLYLRQEGRNIGLLNKVNAYALQDQGYDTVEANHQLGFKDDERTYEIVDFIFDYYKINKIKLLTNNPSKLQSLKVEIIERLPINVGENKENSQYLKVKKEKMDHMI